MRKRKIRPGKMPTCYFQENLKYGKLRCNSKLRQVRTEKGKETKAILDSQIKESKKKMIQRDQGNILIS